MTRDVQDWLVQKLTDELVRLENPILDALAYRRLMLYPRQIPLANELGWTRGKEYEVYKCMKCGEDMDRCACKSKR